MARTTSGLNILRYGLWQLVIWSEPFVRAVNDIGKTLHGSGSQCKCTLFGNDLLCQAAFLCHFRAAFYDQSPLLGHREGLRCNYCVFRMQKKQKFFKGTVPRDFWLRLFSWISFPQAPEYPNMAVLNLFENSQRYLQLKVHHRCRWHRSRFTIYCRSIFFFKLTLRCKQSDIVPDWYRCCILTCEYLCNIRKICNYSNVIFRGWKKPEAKNLVTLSL